MRAIVLGGFDEVAGLAKVDRPAIQPDEYLVAVSAASVNAFDWKIAAGMMANNFEFAFPVTIGRDFAGTIVEAGSEASGFAAGDEVFGYLSSQRLRFGSLAEFVPTANACMALKPRGLSFAAAAALPLAGMTAWRCFEQLDVQSGQTVLIVGAPGGVGSYLVQLTSRAGAKVLATGREDDREYLLALGASAVLDHRGDLPAQLAALAPYGVDAVVDLVNRGDEFMASARLACKGGAAASTHRQADPARLGELGVRAVNAGGIPDPGLLSELGRLAATHELSVPVVGNYTLEQGAEALAFIRDQHVRGKHVVTV